MKRYITSDWHFSHNNICGKDGFVTTRTHFKDVQEMNNTLINAINKVVTNDDELYHLGDICIGLNPSDTFDLLCKLRGQLHLFKGNHDNSRLFKYLNKHNYTMKNGKPKFVTYEVGTILKQNKKIYYLTHYPLGLGELRKNMRSICGHIHEQVASESNVINVGIDSPELPSSHPFGEPLKMETAMELVDTKWEKWYETTINNM